VPPDDNRRWQQRPVQSALLRAFVFVIPTLASVAAALVASALLPVPEGVGELIAWWLVLTAISLVVLVVVDRLARRLLPLVALLRLSMLFPDRAPSRFKIAREAVSVRRLSSRLQHARTHGLGGEPAEAAKTIITLISALGAHDRKTRGHSERVHVFTELIAEEMGLPQSDRDRLRWAALLHDVGKLMVPEVVLNKPGKPDEDEWVTLRRHPEEGTRFIAPLVPWLGEWALAVGQHHEWFDGSGYPQGLSGTNIARAARIVAVADAFEVMTAPRSYRRAVGALAARQELARFAGTQFDPAIVRAFLSISISRLRGAMGPLAFLAPLPSAWRLTSFGEIVAQMGAALGAAGLLIGGGVAASGSSLIDPPPAGPASAAGSATVDIAVTTAADGSTKDGADSEKDQSETGATADGDAAGTSGAGSSAEDIALIRVASKSDAPATPPPASTALPPAFAALREPSPFPPPAAAAPPPALPGSGQIAGSLPAPPVGSASTPGSPPRGSSSGGNPAPSAPNPPPQSAQPPGPPPAPPGPPPAVPPPPPAGPPPDQGPPPNPPDYGDEGGDDDGDGGGDDGAGGHDGDDGADKDKDHDKDQDKDKDKDNNDGGEGNGHDDHGNGNGNGHDHHDDDGDGIPDDQ